MEVRFHPLHQPNLSIVSPVSESILEKQAIKSDKLICANALTNSHSFSYALDERFQNKKRRILILSRDLNYARYNLCGFVKDDVYNAEIAQMFLFCFVFMCL